MANLEIVPQIFEKSMYPSHSNQTRKRNKRDPNWKKRHKICHSMQTCYYIEKTLRTQWASLVAQMVKNPPAIWKTQVQSLGQENLLEKGMATHSNILAWRISWAEEPVSYSPWGHKESDTTEWLTHVHKDSTKITKFNKWIQLNIKIED